MKKEMIEPEHPAFDGVNGEMEGAANACPASS
jgi:hypothetical protein